MGLLGKMMERENEKEQSFRIIWGLKEQPLGFSKSFVV